MEKMFSKFTVFLGCIGGMVASWLGGYDVLLQGIVTLVVVDYATGLLKAWFNQDLSSKTGTKGIVKKVMIFLVIMLAVVVEDIVGSETPIREITIMFFIGNEGISILENASMFLPIPERLKKALLQLRGDEV